MLLIPLQTSGPSIAPIGLGCIWHFCRPVEVAQGLFRPEETLVNLTPEDHRKPVIFTADPVA
ncbi:hypothetical protein BDV32DRAFT_117533 [Aspergillus pseudonomiae]|nr:hypothetical protein BDV32DRAFT_117533 [Aspergillus pseudonomiae]